MNIEQANGIALSEILQKIGYSPAKQRGADIWYLSPLRNEKTPSFKIEAIKNVWFDFGIMRGGDVVSFARFYLESQGEDNTTVDALRWLRNMMISPSVNYRKPATKAETSVPALVLQSVRNLQHEGLIKYLESRGIPLAVARDI